ncbi:hypothetical protein RMATCC62417_16342 [Rhizopus microsporus]|nr:hypothetical protein RMATCC62417_16342 [Rhizopus microsporus]
MYLNALWQRYSGIVDSLDKKRLKQLRLEYLQGSFSVTLRQIPSSFPPVVPQSASILFFGCQCLVLNEASVFAGTLAGCLVVSQSLVPGILTNYS